MDIYTRVLDKDRNINCDGYDYELDWVGHYYTMLEVEGLYLSISGRVVFKSGHIQIESFWANYTSYLKI